MTLFIIALSLFIFGIVAFIIGASRAKYANSITLEKEEQQKQLNQDIQNKEDELYKLRLNEKHIRDEIDDNSIKLINISQELLRQKEKTDDLYLQEKERLEEQINDYNRTISMVREQYISKLESSYQDAEDEYFKKVNSLNKELQSVEENLNKIKSTMQANIEAQLRAKEIKEQLSFYCLSISENDKSDIQRLNNIKSSLNKPRVLSMLIWQTWFQKQLKSLSANILGLKTITGIYKITNITTEECYIGQAVDVASRWNDHAKCGLGIDTPAGSKLYIAMQGYGLWNFSWELLEECPREQLNEKERYYIELYQSNEFGYNSQKGNK